MGLEQWKISVENAKKHLQRVKESKALFVAKSKEGINAQTDKVVKARQKENFQRQVLNYIAQVEEAKRQLDIIKANKPSK